MRAGSGMRALYPTTAAAEQDAARRPGRLRIPNPPTPLVERRRLLDRLSHAVDTAPLTVLCAPAGAGKTVLVFPLGQDRVPGAGVDDGHRTRRRPARLLVARAVGPQRGWCRPGRPEGHALPRGGRRRPAGRPPAALGEDRRSGDRWGGTARCAGGLQGPRRPGRRCRRAPPGGADVPAPAADAAAPLPAGGHRRRTVPGRSRLHEAGAHGAARASRRARG